MAMGVAVVVLMLVGIGGGLLAMRGARREHGGAGQETLAGELSPQEQIDQQVKRTTKAMGFAEEDGGSGPRKARLFGPGDGPALRNWVGETVNLQGCLLHVRDSRSGKTRYLEFSGQRGKNDVCCRFWAREMEEIWLEDLKALEGKTLRFTGLVQIEKGTGRILLHLDDPGQIETVGE